MSLVMVAFVRTVVEADEGVAITVTTPLTISDVSASNIGYYSAIISWKTNGNATSQVFYDTVYPDNITHYRYYTAETTTLVSKHSVLLTGLSSSTTYHYRVRSKIPGTDFIAVSNDYTFTTLTAPPPPPPPAPVVVAPGVVNVSPDSGFAADAAVRQLSHPGLS